MKKIKMQELIKLKNKKSEITTNRDELLKIVEDLYAKLYRSTRQNQIQLQQTNKKTI